MPDPVTGVTAGTAVLGAGMSANAASKASKAAAASEKASLDFAKQQYADWKAVFGPLQDNMASYYSNLTPGRVVAQGREAIELEKTQLMQRLDESFAARGLLDTTFEQATRQDVEMEAARQKAAVRANAPTAVAQEKMSFLTLGYGQNPAGMTQQVLQQQANSSRLNANQQQQVAGQAMSNAVTTAGTALADYFKGGKI